MKIQAKDFEEYFSQTGDRQEQLRQLDQTIRKYAPSMSPTIIGSMNSKFLGYGPIDYKTKSSKESYPWAILLLAVQKNHIALYACAEIDGQYVAEKYKESLGKVSIGKSCIRFKKLSDLDMDGLKSMLEDLNSRYKSGEKLYGI